MQRLATAHGDPANFLTVLTTATPTVLPFCVFWKHSFASTTIIRDFHFRKMLPHILSAAALLFVVRRGTFMKRSP